MTNPEKTKTYAPCKSRIDILKQLADHKVLYRDPDTGEINWIRCACCGTALVSPATTRIVMAAGWIERVGEVLKANGGVFWEEWGISGAGRLVIGQGLET